MANRGELGPGVVPRSQPLRHVPDVEMVCSDFGADFIPREWSCHGGTGVLAGRIGRDRRGPAVVAQIVNVNPIVSGGLQRVCRVTARRIGGELLRDGPGELLDFRPAVPATEGSDQVLPSKCSENRTRLPASPTSSSASCRLRSVSGVSLRSNPSRYNRSNR